MNEFLNDSRMGHADKILPGSIKLIYAKIEAHHKQILKQDFCDLSF